MLKMVRGLRPISARRRLRRRIIKALALNRRGEVRKDGLSLNHFDNRIEIEWRARNVHPWDRDLAPAPAARLFAEQCLDDANAALERLFAILPEVNVIEFRVIDPTSLAQILSGSVTRKDAEAVRAMSSGMKLKEQGVRYRLNNWRFEPIV
jgi:hypothetical protein